jgi:hypothetical protein
MLGFFASSLKRQQNYSSLADAPLPEKALITEVVFSVVTMFTWRISLGLGVFFVIAVATGWLSGNLQGYPYFFIHNLF